MGVSTRRRRTAAQSAAAALAGIAGLHAAWASGSTFPTSSDEALADLVIGTQDTMPAPAVTWLVAAAIGAGALVTLERSRPRPLAPPWERLTCRAGRAVAIVLAFRGVAGLVVSGFGLADESDRFRFWNLVLYSPLCLVLAAGVLAVWTRPRDPETADQEPPAS